MTTPRPSLLDLHPVEALLALLLISATALLRLLRPQVAADWKCQPLVRVTGIPLETSTACAVAARAAAEQVDQQLRRVRGIYLQPSATLRPTVADLRRMVRARGLSEAGGRPISKARRADLIDLLCSY
jgi:hypothetical protein